MEAIHPIEAIATVHDAPLEVRGFSDKPDAASTTKFVDFTPLGDDKPKARNLPSVPKDWSGDPLRVVIVAISLATRPDQNRGGENCNYLGIYPFQGATMTTTNKAFLARLRSAGKGKLTFAIYLILCTLGLPRARAQQINIISFDAPGADTTAGDYNGTLALGMNNWGTITGTYIDINDVYHGFLRTTDGSFTTFEARGADTTPGSYNGTVPWSVNDLGVVTGNYYDANGFSHGFLREPDGKFTTFDPPGVGGSGTSPIAVNLEGAIVGYYTDSNYLYHAFLRSPDGTIKTWSAPDACTDAPQGCIGTGATNINAFGIIVGGYTDNSGNFVHHSYVRGRDGGLNVFDVPGAGTGSYQGTGCGSCYLGFNLQGAVAGIYIDASSVQHSFLRSPDGTFTTFDAPGAGTSSYQGTGCPSGCPTSLNDFGAITGSYIDTNYVQHGYLRSPSGDIKTVDPAGSVGTLPSVIDDLGLITGFYSDASGVSHGFVAVPCNQGCSANDEAAARVTPSTTTNRVNPAFNRVLNPKLRFMPWNRRLGVHPLKQVD
jgi:hypothetical protein